MIRNSVKLYSGHISGFALPPFLKPDALKITGVTCVLKRIPIQGFLTNRNNFASITIVAIEPNQEITHTAIRKKIIQGRYPYNGENALLLSEPVAESLKVRPGDTLNFIPDLSPERGSLTCFDTAILMLSDRELSLFQRRNVGVCFPARQSSFLPDRV